MIWSKRTEITVDGKWIGVRGNDTISFGTRGCLISDDLISSLTIFKLMRRWWDYGIVKNLQTHPIASLVVRPALDLRDLGFRPATIFAFGGISPKSSYTRMLKRQEGIARVDLL